MWVVTIMMIVMIVVVVPEGEVGGVVWVGRMMLGWWVVRIRDSAALSTGDAGREDGTDASYNPQSQRPTHRTQRPNPPSQVGYSRESTRQALDPGNVGCFGRSRPFNRRPFSRSTCIS